MEAIKHSKIIIALAILYSCITIFVVILNQAQKKEDKEEQNKQAEKQESNNSGENEVTFESSISVVLKKVETYVDANNIVSDVCLPLSEVVDKDAIGSAYVTSGVTSIKLWYSDGIKFIEGVELINNDVTDSDIISEFTTPYYNSCGTN